jgi:hypothetical protein
MIMPPSIFARDTGERDFLLVSVRPFQLPDELQPWANACMRGWPRKDSDDAPILLVLADLPGVPPSHNR